MEGGVTMNPNNYKFIGKHTSRKDAKDIVTGRAVFLDDFTLPNMLIGKSLKSPYPHARIVDIDTKAAKELKGVHAVMTYKDVDQNWKMGWPPQKPIMGEKVLYVGDTVALVAAETEQIAGRALDLIEVTYEQYDAVYDGISALKDDAPRLYDEFDHNIVPPGYPPFQKDGPFWHLVRGEVEKGFEACEFIAEDTIEFNKMTAPLSPEPPGAVVKWEGGLNFTIWGTTQSTFILKIVNASIIPGCDLRAKAFNVGGSYGNKQSIALQVMSAALLSMAVFGRPVKFFQTKAEQLLAHETRLGSQVHAKIGMDKNGVVQAVKGEWSVDTGAFCNATQGQVGVGIGEAQLVMAKCPNWDLDSNIVVTNKLPAGIVRGYGGQELNSCLSLLINRTMRKGGFDPVECYKKNYVSAGDTFIWRDGRRWKAHSIDYVKAIEKTAEKFGWKDKWKGWEVPTSISGLKASGVGCGIIGNADVGEDNCEAYVRIVPDMIGDKSKVVMQTDIIESGMGERSSLAKMVAEVLNVPYEDVQLTDPDTLSNPVGCGLAGSRGTITYGRAVSNAAEDAKQQLFRLAEPYLEVPTEAMELEDYSVVAPGRPGKRVSWKQLIPQALTLTGYGKHIENFSTPSMVIVFVEVEVDKKTGIVEVKKIVSGSDVGQIIDPSNLEMQFHGGIGSASLDTALFEENIIDKPTGRLLTCNMIDYKWRPFNEFPEYQTVVLESQFDTFRFKAIGVGEITGGAMAGAAVQAISNAIGVEISTYPATPDVILRALGKR